MCWISWKEGRWWRFIWSWVCKIASNYFCMYVRSICLSKVDFMIVDTTLSMFLKFMTAFWYWKSSPMVNMMWSWSTYLSKVFKKLSNNLLYRFWPGLCNIEDGPSHSSQTGQPWLQRSNPPGWTVGINRFWALTPELRAISTSVWHQRQLLLRVVVDGFICTENIPAEPFGIAVVLIKSPSEYCPGKMFVKVIQNLLSW